MSLLQVQNLSVAFSVPVVRDVSFEIAPGECVALVGESGCGKSMTSLSITRLPPTDRATVSGVVLFHGRPITRPVRGIAYVFQDPMASLNPVMRIGEQLAECVSGPQCSTSTYLASLLNAVDLPDPAGLLRAYPCELSGGMCQRVMIAMALASEPDIIIADEPTTALDVTTQAEVMNLIASVVRKRKMSLLLSTHNLGLVSGRCDKVNVLYAGEIVESGSVDDVMNSPRHPYTRGLINAVPCIEDGRRNQLRDIPGTVPAPDEIADMRGCVFAPRCSSASQSCLEEHPSLAEGVRCHRCVAIN